MPSSSFGGSVRSLAFLAMLMPTDWMVATYARLRSGADWYDTFADIIDTSELRSDEGT